MGYIKSHSNYVLKKRHQLLNDGGRVYERDMATIGGRDNFAPGQVPIYRSGNFVITTNLTSNVKKNLSNSKWEENEDGVIWTLGSVSGKTNGDTEENSTTVVLKNDYYSLADFCYYGSCVEMIRGSVLDIMSRFPGEMYVPNEFGTGINLYISNGNRQDYASTEETVIGGYDKYWLENPFNINIHTQSVDYDKDNELKYFANEGYLNYQVIDKDGNASDITGWTVGEMNEDACMGEEMGEVLITTESGDTYTVYVYCGMECKPVYLVGDEMVESEIHIRPKGRFYDRFIQSLPLFEKVLLNTRTTPLYKATFEVMTENDYGYETKVEDFVFPIGDGGYNIGTDDATYSAYVNRLVKVAEFYDDNFCDNLYKSMSHEAIQNLSDTFKKYEDEGEIVVYDTNKIPNLIRLYGREFDEIKAYIDGISKYNLITYSNRDGLPDYFMTDAVELEGWDVRSVQALHLLEYIYNEDGGKTDVTGKVSADDEKQNTYDGKRLHRNFIEKPLSMFRPYGKEGMEYPYGYYVMCGCDEGEPQIIEATENDRPTYKTDCADVLRPRVDQYSSEVEFTSEDANLHFLKMLKLNSKGLLRHKGTIAGVEMMLSLFGMKSERWFNSLSENQKNEFEGNGIEYDYTINEYTSFTNGIIDKYSNKVGMNKVDWYNYTKTIAYDTEEYKNGMYLPYQGIPVIYKDNGEDKSRTLYPYFDKDAAYDGNPYYQMDGGWRMTGIMFDNDNNIIADAGRLYHETLRYINSVDTLDELFSIPVKKLKEGEIYYVRNITKNFCIIDGIVYEIYEDWKNDEKYEYIKATVHNDSIKLGNVVFEDRIVAKNPFVGDDTIIFEAEEDGSELKLYIVNGTIDIWHESRTVENVTIFRDIDGTHYFKINNPYYSRELSMYGWEQISEDSTDYLKANAINNYFKGNNPHVGYGKYDNGFRYIWNFAQLFGFPLENGYFDERCYVDPNETFEDAYGDKLPFVGFRNLLGGHNECDIEYFLDPDDKVHYFGDYMNTTGGTTPYGEPGNTLTDVVMSHYGNRYGEGMTGLTGNTVDDLVCDAPIDDETYQIVNTKVVDLTFRTKSKDMYSKEWLEEVKYVDSVIMPYVEQMVPSNTIFRVGFENKPVPPVIKNPDYILITYSFGTGKDLDTATDIQDNDDTIIAKVGYGLGYKYPSQPPYLIQHGKDNVNIGSESVIIDLQQVKEQLGDVSFKMNMYATWYQQKGESIDVTIESSRGGGYEIIEHGSYQNYRLTGGTMLDTIEEKGIVIESTSNNPSMYYKEFSYIGTLTYNNAKGNVIVEWNTD